MRTLGKALTRPVGHTALGWEGAGQSYAQYIASLNLQQWYRFNETSGTTLINHGTGGSALNGTWTAGAGALGQTDVMGANEAYDFDGADSKVVVASDALITALSTFTIAALVNADGAGEGNVGQIVNMGNQLDDFLGFFTDPSIFEFDVSMVGAGTNGAARVGGSFIPTTTPVWVFATYDDAGERTPRIYKYVQGGSLVEATYSVSTPATGVKDTPNGMTIGNVADARTWDGLIGELLIANSILSPAILTAIAQKSGF